MGLRAYDLVQRGLRLLFGDGPQKIDVHKGTLDDGGEVGAGCYGAHKGGEPAAPWDAGPVLVIAVPWNKLVVQDRLSNRLEAL